MDKEVVVTCAKATTQQRLCIVIVEQMDMLVRPSSTALGFLDGTKYGAQSGRHPSDCHHHLLAPDRPDDPRWRRCAAALRLQWRKRCCRTM
jgi:hypothetical protein